MVTHWLLIIFQKNDRLFNFVVKKNLKEKLPAAPHKLFWNFREAVDCCPWRVFLVWGTTVFFYFRKTCVSRRYFPRVRFGFWKKKPNHPQQQQQQQRAQREWMKRELLIVPGWWFFPIFLKKTRNLLLLLSFISSDKILANGFLFVLSLTCLSLSVLAKRCRKRRAKSSNVFTLIGHGARWEGGGTKLVHSTPSIIQGTFVNDRGENVWNLFQHNKKKRRANLFGCRISKKFWNEKIRGLWHNAENSLFSVNLRAKKCEIISSGRGHGAGWGGGLLGGGEGRGVLVPKIWINFFFFFYLVAAHRFVVFFFSGGKKLLEIICWIFVRKKRIGRRNLLNIFSFVVLLVRFEINHRVQLFGCVPVWMKWFFY